MNTRTLKNEIYFSEIREKLDSKKLNHILNRIINLCILFLFLFYRNIVAKY